MKIAINGFGRIGKNFFCALMEDSDALKYIDLVAINGYNQEPEVLVHNIKYDTFLGRFNQELRLDGDVLSVAGKKIKLLMGRTPADCDWGSLDVDWVIDCSGCYTSYEDAIEHIKAGAKKVLISAPAKGDDKTIVPGVNEKEYNPEQAVISLGSCTTNAIVPMLKVLHDAFGVEAGFMTTIHAYTNSQALQDSVCRKKDMRKRRAGALNTIPTTTGASKAISKVLPELEGKIEAMALRVPVGLGSLIDLVVNLKKPVTQKLVNDAFEKAKSTMSMPEIVDVSHEALVSSDYIGNGHSVIIDAELTIAHGNTAKVFGWYDNEWAYSKRMKDFLRYVAEKAS